MPTLPASLEMLQEILEALLGPAGALVLAVLILYGIYKLTVDHLIPIIKNWFDTNQENIKELMDEHRKDREAFTNSIEKLLIRFQEHEKDIKEIKTDIGDIKENLNKVIDEEAN